MIKRFDLPDRLQARTALLAISRSTLRNQGASGLISAARRFLREMNLRKFSVTTRDEFDQVLERHTRFLMKRFPLEARTNWGAARKALNIFLRDVFYCYPLNVAHGLSNLEPWLEVPLDSNVYDGLVADLDGIQSLPKWPGVRHLSREISCTLQASAEAMASRLKIQRVHLDVRYWRKQAIDELKG
jgi:hypothetical protein